MQLPPLLSKHKPRKPAHRPRLAAVVCILLLVPCLLSGCGPKNDAKHETDIPEVTVIKPKVQEVIEYLDLTGSMQSVQSAELRARVSGYLKSIRFTDGDFVTEGQLLFVIEQEPYQARLKLAQANVASAEAALVRSTLEYQRQVELLKKRATAEAQVESWRAERDAAQANLDQARANADLAAIDLSYTEVKAPFDGRVDRHLVDPGNLVGSGQSTVLAVISRLDPIYAYFTVNEQEVLRVRAARREQGQTNYREQPVPVYLAVAGEQGYPHQGVVDYVATSLEPSTGTLQVRAVFRNPRVPWPPILQPGMYVRLRIPVTSDRNALVVPEEALGVNQGQRFLLVVNEQNVVEQRQVEPGTREDGMRQIKKGLSAEDSIVLSGIQRARPGSKVTPKYKEEKDEQAAPPQEQTRP